MYSKQAGGCVLVYYATFLKTSGGLSVFKASEKLLLIHQVKKYN